MMKVMRNILACLLLCGLVSVQAGLLSPEGEAYQAIVVQEGAPSSVKLAAREVQTLLKEMTGSELPIVSATEAKPVVYVGANPALSDLGLTADKLPSEGWAIKTGKGFLALYGRDYNGPLLFGDRNPWRPTESYNAELEFNAFGENGSLMAVHEFFHRVLGVRFYMPGDDGTVVPQQENPQLKELDMTGAPVVTWRWAWMCMLLNNTDVALWANRIGIGGKAPVMINHSYLFFLKYKSCNPEYFALVDGKRSFGSECSASGEGHLCLTNPATIQQWVDDINVYFDANPEVEIYPVSPNDGLNRICECPNCQAELRPDRPQHGQYSYHVWNFASKIAQKVNEKHPGKYIGVLAYEKYRMPPEEDIDLSHVAVMYTNFRSHLAQPEYRETLHRELTEVSQRAGRLYLWSWYLDHWMPWTYLPVPMTQTIHDELTFLYSLPNYCGEFIESENQQKDYDVIPTPGMQHLNLYVTGRMFMDASTDAKQLVAEYAKLFYGPAEKPMLDFWTRAEARHREISQEKKEFTPDQMFTSEVISALKADLEEAVNLTPEDSIYRRRVMIIKSEFDQGAARLVRLEATGKRTLKMPIINGFEDFKQVKGEKFMTKDGAATSPATWMYVGRDRQFLYLRFIAYEPDMKSLQEKYTEHDDGNLWLDDSVELYFHPDENDPKRGYQLIINSAGTIYDARINALNDNDPSWESQCEVQVTKEDKRWLVEVKLPFAAIGINDPNFAGNLVSNFYRNRTRDGKPHFSSCWSPTGQGYHGCPEFFGYLILH